MAASKDDICRAALTLPESDRVDLIGALLDSLDQEAEAGVEAAWLAEIDRRARELESGAVKGIPWEVVRERLALASRSGRSAPGRA
jgi:putative addiction module component (TIGR02574 family)